MFSTPPPSKARLRAVDLMGSRPQDARTCPECGSDLLDGDVCELCLADLGEQFVAVLQEKNQQLHHLRSCEILRDLIPWLEKWNAVEDFAMWETEIQWYETGMEAAMPTRLISGDDHGWPLS
jgi:hypothetical protein